MLSAVAEVPVARFLVYWLTTTLALWVSDTVLAGVHVPSTPALLVAGLVLGVINAIVRPILVILTLPITIITLGLFYLVVNGLAFALAAGLVEGFAVDSLGWAIAGAFVVSVVSWFVGLFAD
jgi:putative membrane protein